MPTPQRVSWWLAGLVMVDLLALWHAHHKPWPLMFAFLIAVYLAGEILWRRR